MAKFAMVDLYPYPDPTARIQADWTRAVAQKVRYYRRVNKLTPSDVSVALRVSVGVVKQMEASGSGLSCRRLEQLARLFGVSVMTLIDAPAAYAVRRV